MNLYDKRELLRRLDKGFDLKNNEYEVLISNGNYELGKKLLLLDSEDFIPTLVEYTTLGALASRMSYDGDKTLSRACTYMVASLGVNIFNYINGLEDGEIAYNRLCRFNTVNFIREVAEIQRFDNLIGDLHDSISDVVEYGFCIDSSSELEDRIYDLEKSRGKIKILRNKYIK